MQLKIAQQSTEASQLNSALNNPLIGNSQRMRIVRAMIAKLANSNSTVLITGESGTGKEQHVGGGHLIILCRADLPDVRLEIDGVAA